jgi:hypothetical protein
VNVEIVHVSYFKLMCHKDPPRCAYCTGIDTDRKGRWFCNPTGNQQTGRRLSKERIWNMAEAPKNCPLKAATPAPEAGRKEDK